MHCVWLGLINTYNVAGNQASRARVIIGEHFGLHYWTKSLPPMCVSICVCARLCVWKRGTEEEQETPAYCAALYAIMLNHMDRQVLCHNCKGTFDMVWYRGANKHKSPILLAQCQPVSHPLRQRASAGLCDVRIYLSYWEMQTLAMQPWLNARPVCAIPQLYSSAPRTDVKAPACITHIGEITFERLVGLQLLSAWHHVWMYPNTH